MDWMSEWMVCNDGFTVVGSVSAKSTCQADRT